jgi:CHAT domain
VTLTLREHLSPDEAFVSWYAHRERGELIGVVGTVDGIVDAQRMPLAPVEELVTELERQVQAVVTEDDSRCDLPDLLARLGERAVPRALARIARDGRHRRLVALPDGLLNAVPIEFVVGFAAGRQLDDMFVDGVVTAPSASALVYCRRKQPITSPGAAVILVGRVDAEDDGPEEEALAVADTLPFPVTLVRRRDELAALDAPIDFLYVATHGDAPAAVEAGARDADTRWALHFDGGPLSAADFYGGALRLRPGALVVLSACSVGRVLPGPAHELHGLATALFYAGASNVLAARWPVLSEITTSVLGGTVRDHYRDGVTLSSALRARLIDAMRDPALRAFLNHPAEWPCLFGPFTLSGAG